MLAPRLNEGCPLARATFQASTSRGSRDGDTVQIRASGPMGTWTIQPVSSATARLRWPRIAKFRSGGCLSPAPSLFPTDTRGAVVRCSLPVRMWMAGAAIFWTCLRHDAPARGREPSALRALNSGDAIAQLIASLCAGDRRKTARPVAPYWPGVTTPTTAAVIRVASVPEMSVLAPRLAISARRAGTIAAMPPIMMPRLPKLANPHSA